MKKIFFVVVILIMLVISGVFFWNYSINDEMIMNNNVSNENTDASNENTDVSNKKYTIDDIAPKVYGCDGVSVSLWLWNDGTYMYLNDNGVETMGRYSILGDEIHLDYIFLIDRGEDTNASDDDTVTITTGSKILKILSKNPHGAEIKDGDIVLVTLAQSAYEGGQDFYTYLRAYLNRY